MSDTTIIKVDSEFSPQGELGQKYLASGKTVSMRLWDESAGHLEEQSMAREYETVRVRTRRLADLEIEGRPFDSKRGFVGRSERGKAYAYHVKGHFKAVEATHPPGTGE